ncbi:tetratricopeptide repeat protein [Deinococcus yavapaiensis]|uniref:tetratricopeptide repeat protein n=1 Tax=Deinococcus yavapaiensis TaxID=309889 RepID=UPI000DA17617|nr:tetratricopeptide repeat protein [Deinococcus yavapaiensis]
MLHSTFAGLSRMGLLTDLLAHADCALSDVDALGPVGSAMSMVGELELGVAVLFDFGSWSGRLGRHEAARKATERCLARLERLGEREGRVYVLTLANLGECFEHEGDMVAAERCYREAVALSGRHDSGVQCVALRCLAAVLAHRGCFEDAEALVDRTLALPDLDAYHTVMIRVGLADLLLRCTSVRAGEALELPLSARLRITPRYEGVLWPRVLAVQARAALHSNRADLALSSSEEGLTRIGDDHRPREVVELQCARAQALARQGRIEEAFRTLQHALRSALAAQSNSGLSESRACCCARADARPKGTSSWSPCSPRPVWRRISYGRFAKPGNGGREGHAKQAAASRSCTLAPSGAPRSKFLRCSATALVPLKFASTTDKSERIATSDRMSIHEQFDVR